MLWLMMLAAAQELVLDGVVPADDGVDYFVIPFEVPLGTAEVEVRHASVDGADVLDFGLQDPDGFRGWGGGNPEPAIVGTLAASRSYRPGPLPPGTWNVLVGEAQLRSAAPAWHVEIFLRTAASLPPATDRRPYAPVSLGGPGWYAGDNHVHSEDSGDAAPSLDQIVAYARSRGLDYVVITDHNTDSQVPRLGDVQDGARDLLLVPGVEFTTYAGHATGFGATTYVPHTMGFQGADLDVAAAAFADQGALLSINHPMLNLGDRCIGCAWTQDIPAGLAGVELQTGGYAVTGALFYRAAVRFWDDLCDEGRHIAPLGGSDDHRAGEGTGLFDSPIGDPTTRVWAESLSVAGLRQGILDSRTVVQLDGPDGPMVDLQTSPARVGDTVTAAEVALSATVTGADGGELVWVTDGVDGAVVDIVGDPFTAERVVTGPGRFRVELRAADGHPTAVTGNVWVKAPAAEEEGQGCGCAVGSSGWTWLIGVVPWMWRRRGQPGGRS